MNPHYRLDRQIEQHSAGRLGFDAAGRRLTRRDPEGHPTLELAISEAELRGLMQRLLLAVPEPLDDEPVAVAVRLLLAHLDDRD